MSGGPDGQDWFGGGRRTLRWPGREARGLPGRVDAAIWDDTAKKCGHRGEVLEPYGMEDLLGGFVGGGDLRPKKERLAPGFRPVGAAGAHLCRRHRRLFAKLDTLDTVNGDRNDRRPAATALAEPVWLPRSGS
jgi:hypothetical protein